MKNSYFIVSCSILIDISQTFPTIPPVFVKPPQIPNLPIPSNSQRRPLTPIIIHPTIPMARMPRPDPRPVTPPFRGISPIPPSIIIHPTIHPLRMPRPDPRPTTTQSRGISPITPPPPHMMRPNPWPPSVLLRMKKSDPAWLKKLRISRRKPSVASCPLQDVVFVLDTISSVGLDNFTNMLDTCKDIVNAHTFGPSSSLFGLDVFSTNAYTKIKLNDYTVKEALTKAIENVQYIGGLTKTYKALNRLIHTSYSYDYGHRPGVKKVAIVMTDGRSQNKQKTINAARNASRHGIKLIAFGIGNNIDWEEILSIANSNLSAFKVPSFKALTDFNIKKLPYLSFC